MSKHTKTPSENGWYWVADNPEAEDGWMMAFLDVEQDVPTVVTFDPERCMAGFGRVATRWDWDGRVWRDRGYPAGRWSGPECWFGPLNQPGGPFGSHIVEACEEDHQRAEKESKVIGIQHFDFRYCRDEGHGSNITLSGVYTREEAEKITSRMITDEAV